MFIQCAIFHLGIWRTVKEEGEYLITQEENVCEKYIYVNFTDLLFIHPFASQMNSTWQCYYIFTSHSENFYNILISQMVESFEIWFCQMMIYFARPRCCCKIAGKPRETKLSTQCQDIKSTENQVLVWEKLNTRASYS